MRNSISTVNDGITCSPIYYIAGPMRGVYEFNFPAFLAKAKQLRATGCEVFCPAEEDLKRGFDPWGLEGTQAELDAASHPLREVFEMDTQFICRKATHIWMLPGWSSSKGATAERALGLALGFIIEGAAA